MDSENEILRHLHVKKITFNDVKEVNKIDFRIMATALNPKNLFTWSKHTHKLHHKKPQHTLKDITFTGDFPLLDALLVSGSTPQKLTIK